eukprot:snap_masked-scaffold_7-processed-gene-4.34-mRNA-1 protein AED:0.01 eAED:0.05 QI:0/-1/0/1/-1/1/1/0/452
MIKEDSSNTGILGSHDLGGSECADKVVFTDQPLHRWEQVIHALLSILATKHLLNVHELRRSIESLVLTKDITYYGKWARAMTNILLERKVLSPTDFLQHFPVTSIPKEPFKIGVAVQIKEENFSMFWCKPHLRTPGYIFGCIGEIQEYLGEAENPNIKAFHFLHNIKSFAKYFDQKQRLYRVSFQSKDVFKYFEESEKPNKNDEILIEVYEPWLQRVEKNKISPLKRKAEENIDGKSHAHDHEHEERGQVETAAVKRENQTMGSIADEAYCDILVQVLVDKNLVTRKEIEVTILSNSASGSIDNGRRIVIQAWRDDKFRQLLKEDANKALETIGLQGSNPHATTKLVCVFNTMKLHNVIVCTLCSCYPTGLLGPSPLWYKSRSYRSRVVKSPRNVLLEFGTKIDADLKIRVYDSTADCRYMVIPTSPPNLADLSDEELSKGISRNMLIGVER